MKFNIFPILGTLLFSLNSVKALYSQQTYATTLQTVTGSSGGILPTGTLEAIFVKNDGNVDLLNFGDDEPIGFELLIDENNTEGAPVAIIPIFNTTATEIKNGTLVKRGALPEANSDGSTKLPRWVTMIRNQRYYYSHIF